MAGDGDSGRELPARPRGADAPSALPWVMPVSVDTLQEVLDALKAL